MRKEIKIDVQRIVSECHELIISCNACGESVTFSEDKQNYCDMYNMHGFEIRGSYGTSYPGDNDTVQFDLCSQCLEKLVNSFVVPAEYISFE